MLHELSGKSVKGKGYADSKINIGEWKTFQKFRVCIGQGSFKEPGTAAIVHHIYALSSGVVARINNRKLARIAKLAGAPDALSVGIRFLALLGKKSGVGVYHCE